MFSVGSKLNTLCVTQKGISPSSVVNEFQKTFCRSLCTGLVVSEMKLFPGKPEGKNISLFIFSIRIIISDSLVFALSRQLVLFHIKHSLSSFVTRFTSLWYGLRDLPFQRFNDSNYNTL